jgi:hypothetical protein
MGDSAGERVRFAVVGLGNIAQVAVLPAFEHAKEACELVALPFERSQYPGVAQEIRRPPVGKPRTVHAPSPTTRT